MTSEARVSHSGFHLRRTRLVEAFRRTVKITILASYVFLWAPVRHFFRRVRGRCHTTVLVYHRVSDAFHDSVTVGVQQFQDQMLELRKRYDVVDMPQFLSSRLAPCRRPRVVITFDDGYQDNHAAARVLHGLRLPCTFFVCTRIVGTERPFPHDVQRLGHQVPALTWAELSEMRSWGFHIATHTANHVNLSSVPLDQGVTEITTAQQDLREHLGEHEARRWFAYPYGGRGDVPAEILSKLSEFEIDYCFSAYGGVNFSGFDPLDIRRIGVSCGFGRLAFRAAVEGWRTRGT